MSKYVVAVLVLVVFCLSALGFEGFIGLTNGYFYDTATGEPFVPHGIAYQTWNRPLGVWQTYEQIDYDLDEMVKMGANSVRIDIVWQHAEEQGDNIFDWENYDYFVQACEQRGLRIFALVGYQWPPNWFPDAWYTQHPPEWDAEGIYHATRWQSDIINYEHPDARAQYAEWLAAVAGRYKDSKAIAGWIVGNESGYLGLWSGLLDGYDPESEAAFRAWCQAKYGTIEAANAAWGSSFASFDQLSFVEQYRAYGVEGAIWADMVQWREDSIASFTAVGAVGAKSADTNHLISYSTVGMQWGEEDWRYHAEDRGKITEACLASNAAIDFFSVNNYPWSILGHESQNGHWGISYTKKVAKVPVLYSETGFTSSETMWPGMNEFRQGPLVRNSLWESLEAGAVGTHIFSWMDRPWITDREKGFGILYADRRIKPAFWTSRDAFTVMDQVDIHGLLMGSKDPEPDIAFLWTDANDSQYNRYECEMQQIAGAFERLGYEPGFINLAELADGAYTNFKVIVLPRNMRVEDEVGESGKTVLDFIREDVMAAGVHVLASADLPGLQDFNGKPRAAFEQEVDDLFGIDASDIGGFECPMRRREYVSWYWTPIDVTFTEDVPAGLAIGSGYSYRPKLWKYSDEIQATDGDVWAVMDSLRNKGFEDSDGTNVLGWNSWGISAVRENWGWQHDGAKMLQLWGPNSGVWQDFEIVPFGRYTHSAYLRSNGDDPLRNGKQGYVAIEFYDQNEQLLSVAESERLSGATPAVVVDLPAATAWWRMDETNWVANCRLEDSSGNGHLGTAYSGAYTTNAAAAGLAGVFDGMNDYVYVTNRTELQLTNDLTLSFWVWPSTVGSKSAGLLDKSYGDEFTVGIQKDGSLGYCHGWTRSTGYYWNWYAMPAGSLTNGQWYHVAITRDAATRTMRSYLNGALVAVTNYPDDFRYKPSSSTYPIYIGYSYSGYFKGRMDDVRIRPVVLDATQVAAEWATPGTAVQSVNSWVKYTVDAIAPSNAFTARRMIRIQGSGDGSLYADHERFSPALVVKDHGAAKSAIFLYSFGDNMPDGDGDGEMDIGPWKWRYDILGALVRDYFGVQPKLQLKGTNACYALADYRTLADGSTLWQIKNYLYDRFDLATWERLGGGAPQTFTLQSDLLRGKTVEALYGAKIVEEDSDGTISVTLDPDGMEMLLASGEGDGSGGMVSSDGQIFGQDNARTFSADDGPQSLLLTLQRTVSLGTALVISGDRGFYATGTGLFCRDVLSSNLVWSRGVGTGEYFNPRSVTVAGSTVFVTTKNNFGAALGAIYALDARSGAFKWMHSTPGICATPPVVKDGVVYFSGSGDRLHACDVESGQVLWESVSGVSASHFAPISMADGVVVAPAGGTVYGIDTTNGVTLWSRAVRYSYSEGPISIADGRVYVPRNHQRGFEVLDLRTGTQCWQRMDFSLDKFPGVAVDNGRLFVIGVPTSGVPSRALYCFDATQPGNPLWVLALTNVDTYAATPSAANGRVYLSANGSHMAVDAATGAILWSRYTGSNLADAPVIKNRWVFFAGSGYSDGTPWPERAAPSSNQIVRIKDAPSSVTPMGDKAYQVKVSYDCRDREGLRLKLAFMEVGDNGDGISNEVYQVLTNAVVSAGQKVFWVWIPDANPGDADYISTADGGSYQFVAWLEDTGGVRVAEARPQATILKWGVRPTEALPTQLDKGDQVEVPIEWENLNEYLSWENTPLARNSAFPDRVALFRSNKTEAQFPGQLDRANEVADWLESLGYSAGNPLDISFDNVQLEVNDAFAAGPLVIEAEEMAVRTGGSQWDDLWCFWGNGFAENAVTFPSSGVYRLDISACGTPVAGVWPLMEVRIDQQTVAQVSVTSTVPQTYGVDVSVAAGVRGVGLAFVNDLWQDPEDRNLFLDKITLPFGAPLTGDRHFEVETATTRVGEYIYVIDGAIAFSGNGYVEESIPFAASGAYEFRFRARGDAAAGVWPQLDVSVDGAPAAALTINTTSYDEFTATIPVSAGTRNIRIAFNNDCWDPPQDRNLYVDRMSFRDPAAGPGFVEDFEGEEDAVWGRDAGCANWTVEDGALRASRIGNSDNILIAAGTPVGDCTVRADIRYNKQDAYFNDAELFVRYVDRDNFVKVGIRNFYGFWRLKYTVRVGRTLRSQGWIHEFTKATRPLEGDWHNLRVNVAGSTYTVFFDDEEVGSFTDANLAAGRVGVGSSASQLGIWEPQKGFYFVDDDEYSFWAPEGKPQTNGYALNLDWGYLDAFFPTLVLPGTYVMSDAEVSNVTVWLNKGLRSLIATSGGIGMKDETGADAAGRIEPLFGVAGVVDTLGGVTAAVVDDDQHYITLDHKEGDILAASGNAIVWPLPTEGLALGRIHNGTAAQPALIANVITNDPLSPKKVFCFNFDADTDGQLTGSFSNIAKRAFEWARGETYKVRLQLKYSLNPTNQALDLTLITVDGWLLGGNGTSTLVVDIPERGIMTGDNLYWVMYVYPWDADDPWLAHGGFYTTLNDTGSGYVSLAGKGLQIFGITDYAYAGRAWDMWAGYNTRGATCAVVFGIADAGSLLSEDNFNDGDLAGWSVLPQGNTQWANAGDKAQGSSAAGGQAMLVRDGVEVGDANVTISYDVYCNGGSPKEQGLLYRGYVLSIDTQGAWWQNNTVSNFSGIVTNADGSISYVIVGGIGPIFIGPAPLTTGKWQHVTVSIRDGEPTRKCDIYVDGVPYRFNLAMPGTNYAGELVGFVTPKTNGYMLVDNFRVADEAYSFATQKVVGAFVPTNAAQPTFWPFAPDYDPDWYEFSGAATGGRNEWFAYLKGEGVEDRAGVAVYFAPRLMTENAAFPTNITAGSTVSVPIEWENLDQLPVRMVLALQDGRTGAYYVQQVCEIDVATGSGMFSVQVPDTAPTGDEYIWSAYMYPAGEANPWVGRIGADDTARSDKFGAPLDFEVRTRVTGTNGQYVAYSDWGLPVGADAFTWLGSHNGAFTNWPAAEGIQSWRAVLGSSTYAGWGVFYPNRAINLDQFNYLKFWIKTVEPLKIEVEAPKGTKKTIVLNNTYWDPSRPDDWQEITIPKSAFGFQWNLLYDVYGPFMATLVLPTHYGVDMLGESAAWVVSSSADYRYSVLRTTTDGGVTWSLRNLQTNAVLRAVDFVDENTGWAVGYYGGICKVFKTTDGGDTWVQQALPSTVNYLFSVCALDAQTVWAGGSQGVVYRTTDGGATWTAVAVPITQVNKILFIDANIGWVIGQNRTLARTTDGGATWTLVTLTSGGQTYSALGDVHFFDALNGWVSGGYGLLAKTTDGGLTWTPVSYGSSSSVACMEWVDSQRGYVAAYGTYGYVYATTNGGATWSSGISSGVYYPTDIKFWDADSGMMVGDRGSIAKSTGIDAYGRPTWANATVVSANFLIDHVRWTEKP